MVAALAAELGVPWVYEVRGLLEQTWVAGRPDAAARDRAAASERFVRGAGRCNGHNPKPRALIIMAIGTLILAYVSILLGALFVLSVVHEWRRRRIQRRPQRKFEAARGDGEAEPVHGNPTAGQDGDIVPAINRCNRTNLRTSFPRAAQAAQNR